MFNTRSKDFYDAYILATAQKCDNDIFTEALKATLHIKAQPNNIRIYLQF